MTKFETSKFLIRIIFNNLLLLILPQITYSAPLGRNRAWVFWYYSNDGQRDCGNYCVLTFCIVAGIILILILCGCWSCYRINRNAKKEGRAYSFSPSLRTQSFRDYFRQ